MPNLSTPGEPPVFAANGSSSASVPGQASASPAPPGAPSSGTGSPSRSTGDDPPPWPPTTFEIEPLATPGGGTAFDLLPPAADLTAIDAPPRPPAGSGPVGGSPGAVPGSTGSGATSAAMLGAAPPRPVWELLRAPLAESGAPQAPPLADLPGLFEPPPVNLWEDHSQARATGVGIEAPRPPKPPRPERQPSSWDIYADDEPAPPPPPEKHLTIGHVVAIVAFVLAVAFIATFVVRSKVSKTPPPVPTTAVQPGVHH